MKILVRLPNWLGDLIMSTAFLKALRLNYPTAEIEVIVKKGLDPLIDLIPEINDCFVFNRDEWKGLAGAFRFGETIKRKKEYDLFFCLPDSFSSATMGWTAGATKRIGFKKEFRSLLLTDPFQRPSAMHRVEEYVYLLQQYLKKDISVPPVALTVDIATLPKRILLNFNSEAVSRRLPVDKAVSLLNKLSKNFQGYEFICIGSEKEKEHVNAIIEKAINSISIVNQAGQLGTVSELAELLSSGAVLISTDSGPAHMANALSVPVVVLFGAGNEKNTAPYNKERLSVIRLGELPCEPCVKNTCKFGSPKCLQLLDEENIVIAVKKLLGL